MIQIRNQTNFKIEKLQHLELPKQVQPESIDIRHK